MIPFGVESGRPERSKSHKESGLHGVWNRFKRLKTSLNTNPWVFCILAVIILISIIVFGTLSVPNHPPDNSNVPEVELLLSGLESLASRLPGAALSQDSQSNAQNGSRRITISPTFQRVLKRDVVWQIPENPLSVLFLAHGCGQKATYFFDQHPNCESCFGMPEDRVIALDALVRDFAVIAIKSLSVCWDIELEEHNSLDTLTVVSILNSWRKNHSLSDLPLNGIGISSGGYFLSVLAHSIQFDSISLYLSYGIPRAYTQTKFGSYPPTLFVHMPRDIHTATFVKDAIQNLNRQMVEASEIECLPISIFPNYFSQRIVGLNRSVSIEIFGALKKENYLDENNYLIDDPRESDWKSILKKHNVVPILKNNVLKWERELEEELNLAFAQHEMTSLKASETFDWFRKRCLLNGMYRHHRCTNHTMIVN